MVEVSLQDLLRISSFGGGDCFSSCAFAHIVYVSAELSVSFLSMVFKYACPSVCLCVARPGGHMCEFSLARC